MRLANEEADLHRAGAEIVAVSVDPEGRNEALRRRWMLPFPILSDPGGVDLLQPLDAWNPAERGGIGWPTLILFAPDSRDVFRMRSRDFADRPADHDVISAATGLRLAPVVLGPAPVTDAPEEFEGAFRTEAFGPYFRGLGFGTAGLAGRMVDERDRVEASAMSTMAGSFLDAWKQRRSAQG